MASKIVIDVQTKDRSSSGLKSILQNVVGLNASLELFSKVATGLSAPFKSMISEGAEFSAQMSTIGSISKDVAKNLGALEAEAKAIGESTAFSATEAAGAMEELARAGQNSGQIIATTGQAMALAAATGSDLSRAAGVMAVQLNQFAESGLTAQAAADLMTQTVGASPQTFEHLAGALETSAGTAAGFGIKFDELTVILGSMANAGVRGEKAGTALNGALARLANPTKKVSEGLKKIGVSVDQVNPLTNDFGDILDVLSNSGATAADILKIIGQEAGPKFIKVIKGGSKGLKKFTKDQKNANTAAEAQKIAMDNLTGDFKIFQSTLSSIKLSVFEALEPLLRKITAGTTELLGSMKGFFRAHANQLADALTAFAVVIGGMEDFFADFVRSNEGTFRQIADTIKGIFEKIGTAVGGFFAKHESTFKAIAQLAIDIGSKLAEIASVVLDLVMPALTPLADIAIRLVKLFAEFASKGLDLVLSSLKEVAPLFKSLGDVLSASVTPVVNKAKEGLEFLLTSMQKIGSWLKGSDSEPGIFTTALDAITGAAGDLEEKLTGNTLSESLLEVAGILRDMGKEELPGTKKDLDKITKAAGGTEKALVKAGKAGKKAGKELTPAQKAAAQEKIDAGIMGDAGGKLVGGITGVQGGTAAAAAGGGPLAVAIAALAEAVTKNERFQKLTGMLNDTIDELLAPVIDAAVLALEPIVPLLLELKPIFKGIGKGVQVLAHWIKTSIEASQKFQEKLNDATNSWRETVDDVQNAMQGMSDKMGAVLTNIGDKIREAMTAAFNAFNAAFGEEIRAITGDITEGFTKFGTDLANLGGGFATTIDDFKLAISPVTDAIVGIGTQLGDVALALGEGLLTALKAIPTALNGLKKWVNKLFREIVLRLRPILVKLFEPIKALGENIALLFGPEGAFAQLGGAIRGLTQPIKDLRDAITGFFDDLKNPSGGGGGTTGNDAVDSGLNIISGGTFASGRVAGQAPVQIIVQSIDPRSQAEEIRQLLEEMFLSGRLRVA